MPSSNLIFNLQTIRKIINGKIIFIPTINKDQPDNTFETLDFKNIVIEQFIYDLRLINPSNKLQNGTQCVNQIFITLQGTIAHGREYIKDAYQKGILNYWVDSNPTRKEKDEFPGTIWLISKDPLHDLQKLAEYARDFYSLPVVGITGSNGKTIVKEWLSTLLTSMPEKGSLEYELHKSPESFNSQLGVAISVLGLRPNHSLAIFEAGISNMNEMEKLAAMIKPTIGIFTHTGDAHAAGFSSFEEKIYQKLNLFQLSNPKCNSLIVHKYNRAFSIIINYCIQNKIKLIVVDEISNFNLEKSYQNEIKYENIERILFKPPSNVFDDKEAEWEILLPDHNKYYNDIFRFRFTLFDEASTHNMELAVAAALILGENPITLIKKPEHLKPISMRMEIIEDNAEITIWNDAYNADITSVRNALRRFVILKNENEKFHHQSTKLKLILSDLEHQGAMQVDHQNRILNEAIELFGSNNIILIGKVFVQIIKETGISVETYENIDLLISEFNYDYFKNSYVLLKGSRKYELERLIPYLSNRPNSAYLKINLSALRKNFLILRKKIPGQTHTIAMLKAAAYGGGLKQIALELEKLPINYFAVAFTGEGIELRKNGIQKPTLVLNPDETSLSQIFNYNLEPVISSFKLLNKIISEKKRTSPAGIAKIHLEFDTGMGRLGFDPQDANKLLKIFRENHSFEVISIFTHLSSADEIEADEFTNSQLSRFKEIIHLFSPYFPNLKFHALNTAGIIRFGQSENNFLSISADRLMVRLGIGLYGIDPLKQYNYDVSNYIGYYSKEDELEEVVSLIVSINQIHEYDIGTPIGYGRGFITQRKTRIATLPIGYADGIPRCIGLGKYSVFVHGKLRPVVGKVCMDMMMIDVTDEPYVNESDEVLIFGKLGETFLSVYYLSAAAETIPYEILTGIGYRVRRVYVNE